MPQRLKSRAQFQAVLAGQTVSRTLHFALHRLSLSSGAATGGHPQFQQGEAGHPWIGAMTPKRWARRAVSRNSIKRQIHTVSADFESRLADAAYVVRLRSAFDRTRFVSATSDALKRAVRAELFHLFDRLPAAGGLDSPPFPAT